MYDFMLGCFLTVTFMYDWWLSTVAFLPPMEWSIGFCRANSYFAWDVNHWSKHIGIYRLSQSEKIANRDDVILVLVVICKASSWYECLRQIVLPWLMAWSPPSEVPGTSSRRLEVSYTKIWERPAYKFCLHRLITVYEDTYRSPKRVVVSLPSWKSSSMNTYIPTDM